MSTSGPGPATRFADARNRTLVVNGTSFGYRDVGSGTGVPIVMLNHWGAVLDNFDPRIVDGLASRHRVVMIDYRGIGSSAGTAPDSVEAMARDTIDMIRALGLEQVDLFGFSLGGFVAQEVALKEPRLVRRMVLAGTGPAGGPGIARIWSVSWPLILKGLLTLRDPKHHLFFTSTANGQRAARAFLARLEERTAGRVRGPTPAAFLNQLKAIRGWGRRAPQDLTSLKMPVLVMNGDHDIMVPTENSVDMARRIPGARLVIYPDAGHGGVFQFHAEAVGEALDFLRDSL